MIKVAYQRAGLLRSELIFFAEKLPSTAGLDCVICENCFSKLPYHPNFIPKEKNTITIDLTRDVDVLLKKLHKTRRQLIKASSQIGYCLTHQEASIGLLREFKKLYNKFIPGKGATPIVSLRYFEALMPHMTAFIGKYEDRILNIELVLHDDQTVKAFYQARDENFQDIKALNAIGSAMDWEIMMHFKRLGHQTFDFGGLVEGRPSLNFYKRSFGGEIIPVYDYDVALTPLARAFLKIRNIGERQIRHFLHKNLE